MTALHLAALQPLASGQPLTARSYLRVSEDRAKERRSTTEQHGENTSAIEAQGWVQGEPYRDDDRSASRYARQVRDDFQRLMRDLEEGTFGADILVLWETSRGSRTMSEWVGLIDLLEEVGVLVYVTTHARLYDPRNWRDRRTLLEDGTDNEAESRKVSMRTKRTAAAQAAQGRPTGKCPFGYKRQYDPNTGRMITQVPDPETAPLVREVFERIAQGHALLAIAKDWEARGITNAKGTPYSANHIRTLARTHAYTGIRVHIPGRPKRNVHTIVRPEHLIEANWEPIVDRDLFWRVQGILDNPARKVTRPGRANHLLSSIALCGVCQSVMVWRAHLPPKGGEREASYACRNGHVRVLEADLDRLAEDLLLGYLAGEQLAEDLAAKEADGSQLRAVRDEIGALRGRLQEIEGALEGDEEIDLLLRAATRIRKSLDQAEQRERDLTTPEELRGLIKPGPGVEGRWRDPSMALAAKRAVARLVFAPDALGSLYVLRAPQALGPYRTPIEQRVRVGEE